MSRLTLDPEVHDDLKEILEYIAARNRDAASRLRKRFFNQFRALAKAPGMGQKRDDLAPEIRIFPVGNYVIAYRSNSDGVQIMQVIHAARDLDALFREPEDD